MKTVEEFIKEIGKSESLQKEIKAIKDKDALADFIKKNDVGAPIDEFVKAIRANNETEGELADDDAEVVAGGDCSGLHKYFRSMIMDGDGEQVEYFRSLIQGGDGAVQ